MWEQFIKDNASLIIPGIFGLIGIIVGALAAFAPSLLNRGLTRANENHTDAETAQIFTDLTEKAIERMQKIHDLEMAEQKRQMAEIRESLKDMTEKYEAIRCISNDQADKISTLELQYKRIKRELETSNQQRDAYLAQLVENSIVPKE